MTVLFAILEALFVTISNIAAGAAGRRSSTLFTLAIAAPISLGLTLLAAMTIPGAPSLPATGWGIAAGLAGATGLFIVYRSLALGPIGAVAACLQCATTIVVAVSGAVLFGGMSTVRLGALVLLLVAIALICLLPPRSGAGGERPLEPRAGGRVLGPALGVIGGAFYGAFIVAAGQAPAGSGLWTMVAARVTITIVVVAAAAVAAAVRPRRARPSTATIWIAGAAGLTDGAATVSLALALMGKDLVLLALIGASAPALSALLGRALLKERLSRWQVVGLVTAVLGAAIAAT